MATVLIVDDEPNIRRMVGALLSAEGYEVRDAANAASGLELAREIAPDVALIDLMMPGGVDGIIKEDKLGLDAIYLQAKRWEATVGRPEIQKFAGALQGLRATKGIFITISSYSKDALEYVQQISSKIILLDGKTLVRYMVEHNVGVSTVGRYEIKSVDSDYFEME